ncbi:hypothetical protein JOL79_06925 [Microbispora sp. RL4-1S]|uniref:WDGH domain-containing protein n=1 Tax=Microbispora oryzae TaxID=2806554 RepID=A0A940WDN5_9ACTN|nr:hypothetical protein [Microbispora oryzae]MBP2703531.1 hypothetical protein [Microbispora oryzae]
MTTETHFRPADTLPGYSICSRCEVPTPNDRVRLHAEAHAAQDRWNAELRGLVSQLQVQLVEAQGRLDEQPALPSALPPPVLDDDELGFGPISDEALQRWVTAPRERFVRVRLAGSADDVQAALALLHSRHIHLDATSGPVLRRDARGVNLYGTIDIGEWLRFAAGQLAERPPTGAARIAAEVAELRQQVARTYEDGEALNEAYRERARLVAFLAAVFPAVIAYNDEQSPEWPVVYVDTPCGQLSWHIAERDLYLFEHVQRVDGGDVRAAWDGHNTGEKYVRLQQLVERTVLRERAPAEGGM